MNILINGDQVIITIPDEVDRDAFVADLRKFCAAHESRGGAFAYFRSYFSDEESWAVAITEEEFALLKQDEDALANGNWTPLAEEIMNRPPVDSIDFNRCVEIAVC